MGPPRAASFALSQCMTRTGSFRAASLWPSRPNRSRRNDLHARRLLQQTELPLIEIAIACGFQSQSHFSRLYRKQFGVSPLLDVGIRQIDDPLPDSDCSEGARKCTI
ncbi:MAG: AraC family transcriptional regulator [Gammaproteobacteria bacterium]|nr:AraC family transcriptional regulator [Gammaproteobacteria bacterium]